MLISGFQAVNDSRRWPRILFVLSCAYGRCCTFSLVADEACVMVWSCPEYGTLVRIMLLLYGEETTTFTGLIYGRSGSRTVTTHQSLLSPHGYKGVKVYVLLRAERRPKSHCLWLPRYKDPCRYKEAV